MVVEEVIDLTEVLSGQFGFLINLLAALGVFVIVYILFSIVNTIINNKRNKAIFKIQKDVEEIKKLIKNKK